METTITREGNILVIKMPINENPSPSSSGKTLLVASTHGNQKTSILVKNRPVIVGVTAYIKSE